MYKRNVGREPQPEYLKVNHVCIKFSGGTNIDGIECVGILLAKKCVDKSM